MAVVNIFGRDIPVRDTTCSLNGKEPVPVTAPYVNLFVRMTNCCLSNCGFCIYHKQVKSPLEVSDKFVRYTFIEVLEELKKKVRLNKVAFTGGEPLLKQSDLQYALQEIKKRFPEVHVTLNTNGWFIRELSTVSNLVDCISISRHHYSPKANAEIMGPTEAYTGSEWIHIEQVLKNNHHLKSEREKFHLRCNLIKGYIDSAKEVALYLDKMSTYGVIDFGFVSLMKLNSFCNDKFVPPVNIASLPDTVMTKEWSKGTCRCQNYLHLTRTGNLVTIYDRVDDCPGDTTGTLVYDVDRLKLGFNGEVIYGGI